MSVSNKVRQNEKMKISFISNDVNNRVTKVIKNYTGSRGNSDIITENNHRSTKLLSTRNIAIDKNLKCKLYDEDSANARKRFKNCHESPQTKYNLSNSKSKLSKIKNIDNNDLQSCLNNTNSQTSIKNTEGIDTIQNHTNFHIKIVGNKHSTIGADVTKTFEQLNKKKLSITEGLKLFPGDSKHEQFGSFLKMKVIDWIRKQGTQVIKDNKKIEKRIDKYKSLIDKLNTVQNELNEKYGNLLVNGNSMSKNLSLSDEELNKSLNANEIDPGKKQSTNPSTSEELAITTTMVSSSILNSPTTTKINIIDLTESDGENELSTNSSTSKEQIIPTTKVVKPTFTNTNCIGLTGSDVENENFELPTTISNSNAFSKQPNSYLQPGTLLPLHFSWAINPNQLQSSTSIVTNPCTPYQLLNCKIIQPQPNNALQILLPSTQSFIVKSIPALPTFLYYTKPDWRDMLLQKPQLYLSKRLTPSEIQVHWCYIPEVNNYSLFARIVCFQIYMFPGTKNSNEWEYLSEVDAFPINCIITGFDCNKEHYFVVRAKDEYGRFGPFSTPLVVNRK